MLRPRRPARSAGPALAVAPALAATLSSTLVAAGIALLAAATAPGPASAGGLTIPRFARPPALDRLAPPPPLEHGAGAPVAWREPNAGLAEARRDKKPVLVDIEVSWSSWCPRMLRTTYADAGVREDIARSFVAIRLDAEEDDRRVTYDGRPLSQRAFADRFHVSTFPTTVFLEPDGTPITRVPGYVAPGRFRLLLRYVAEGHYRKTTWEEFAGPPPDSDEGRP